ncbi:MAG: polysaccharide biosynthesis tyrosine autokinase [Anaerolineales bacterium]|nr:polysaccharide biosynthesis tyrosine autokinase [Anaerolineales bacterium]
MDEFDFSASNSNSASTDIKQYLWLIWQWAWLIALVAILAGAGAYIYSRMQTPIYQAQATVLINEASSRTTADSTAIYLTSDRLTQTYAEMMVKQPVLDEVAANLGIESVSSGALSVRSVTNTQLLTLTVEDSDPYRAANIANETINVFSEKILGLQSSRYLSSKENLQNQLNYLEQQIDANTQALDAIIQENIALLQNQQTDAQKKDPTAEPATLSELEAQARQINRTEIEQIETRLTQYSQIYANVLASFEQIRLAEAQTAVSFMIVEPAEPMLIAVRPQILRNTLLAAMVGLMLAIGVIFAVELLDDTVKDPEALSNQTGVPLLATIIRHDQTALPITQSSPRSPASEAFRTLRTNVQYTGVDQAHRTIMVTSPTPQDGKTTVSANLAIVLAQSGRIVTLIDADMRRPRVHEALSLTNTTGLSDLFVKPFLDLNGYAQKTTTEGLKILTSGKTPPNPSELLGSYRMKDILDGITQESDVIIIDTPPVLSVTDAAVLSSEVDGVVVVIKPGFTRQTAVIQTVEQLRKVNARILGLVLNDVDAKKSRYYYYKNYYHYSSYYTENGGKKRKKTHTEEVD